MTVRVEELQMLIGTMIAPGDAAPLAETVVTKVGGAAFASQSQPSQQGEEFGEIAADATPKFCKNCGEKLNSGSKFCKKCGNKIG